MGIDSSLLVVILCVTFIVLLLIFVLVCIVQEQREKCKRVERVSRKERTYYLQGIQQAESYLQKKGFDEVVEYSNKAIPINDIDTIESGWVDYIEYYENVLKDLVSEDKPHEELQYNHALDNKISERKDALKKYRFKENIRW